MTQFSAPGVVKAYVGQDFRGTAGLHLSPSGGIATKPVVFSELDDVRDQLESAFAAADSADTLAWTTAIANLSTQLNNTIQGVTRLVSVAVRFGSYDAVVNAGGRSNIAGLNPNAAADDPSGWFLLNRIGAELEFNGIYRFTDETNFERVANFNTADEFKAGTLVYVDAINSFYLIQDDAVAGTIGNQIIVSFVPFGRVQDLTSAAASPIAVVNNTLALLYDANFTVAQVAGGGFELKLSEEFIERINVVEADVATLEMDVDTLDTRVSSAESDLASLAARADAIETVNQTQDAAIVDLNATLAAHTDAIDALGAETTSISASLSDLADAVAMPAGVIATLIAFEKFMKVVVTLAGGVYSASDNMTVFYVDPGFGSLRFAVTRLSETAAPYGVLREPSIEYVTEDNNGTGGHFAKITFWASAQVPNSTIEAFCDRYLAANETPVLSYVAQ